MANFAPGMQGGKLIDIKNGISPGDSFIEALKTVTEAAAK